MCQISILFGLIKFVDNKSNGLIGVLGGGVKVKDNFIKWWSYGYSNLSGL